MRVIVAVDSKSQLVYIPATISRLKTFLKEESYTPVSLLAFGITPLLKEKYIYDEDEELSHIAFLAASDASLRLIAGELVDNANSDCRARRVVISVRVDFAKPRGHLDDCALELAGPVSLKQVEAFFVDGKEMENLVATAALAVDEADLGSEEAQYLIEETHDNFLAWYSVQEVPFLIELIDE